MKLLFILIISGSFIYYARFQFEFETSDDEPSNEDSSINEHTKIPDSGFPDTIPTDSNDSVTPNNDSNNDPNNDPNNNTNNENNLPETPEWPFADPPYVTNQETINPDFNTHPPNKNDNSDLYTENPLGNSYLQPNTTQSNPFENSNDINPNNNNNNNYDNYHNDNNNNDNNNNQSNTNITNNYNPTNDFNIFSQPTYGNIHKNNSYVDYNNNNHDDNLNYFNNISDMNLFNSTIDPVYDHLFDNNNNNTNNLIDIGNLNNSDPLIGNNNIENTSEPLFDGNINPNRDDDKPIDKDVENDIKPSCSQLCHYDRPNKIFDGTNRENIIKAMIMKLQILNNKINKMHGKCSKIHNAIRMYKSVLDLKRQDSYIADKYERLNERLNYCQNKQNLLKDKHDEFLKKVRDLQVSEARADGTIVPPPLPIPWPKNYVSTIAFDNTPLAFLHGCKC